MRSRVSTRFAWLELPGPPVLESQGLCEAVLQQQVDRIRCWPRNLAICWPTAFKVIKWFELDHHKLDFNNQKDT